MKLLICDDEQSRFDEVAEAVSASGVADLEVQPLVGPKLTAALEQLFDDVKVCLKDPRSYKAPASTAFDADIAIFDNNLAQLDIKGMRLTAESIVGYVRAFTAVPYVVSLNKNPDVDFDLRYLVGDFETRADVALNTDHLKRRALWTKPGPKDQQDFAPWYWPELANVADRRRKQITFVKSHLNEKVLEALGFPSDEDSLGFLSLHARGALAPEAAQEEEAPAGPDAAAVGEVTFRDVFVARSRSLPTKSERETLVAAAGASGAVDTVISRVVASDIDLWFRRDVLGPEEMLVDVPHLLTRMPFLLGKQATSLDAWNAAASSSKEPFGLDQGHYAKHLAPALFKHVEWCPVPAFWWPKLKADDALGELFFKSGEGEWADAVFCEDTSRFVLRPADGAGGPVEFAGEFEGSWNRRQVARLPGFKYAPRSRFAV